MSSHRPLVALLALILVAGCGGTSTTGGTRSEATEAPAPTEEYTIEPEPEVEPAPTIKLPASYTTLDARGWAKVVKAPDNYAGKGYALWACIWQFDAATGSESFLAYTSYKKQEYWLTEGENAMFTGTSSRLADYVEGDMVYMKAVVAGSYSYDTQAGGNTTVPWFYIAQISRKGSCE